MAQRSSFNRERFLFYMLAGIFIWQAALFSYGIVYCFQNGGLKACPSAGDRYENTVNVMVATTLALLGAGAVASATASNAKKDEPIDQDDGSKKTARKAPEKPS